VLPGEIKQYILSLTLKHRQEMYDVIMQPLKQTLNCEIKIYGLKRSLPHIKTVALRHGFFRTRNRSKQNLSLLFIQSVGRTGIIILTSV